MFDKLIASTTDGRTNAKQSAYFGITALLNLTVFAAILIWSIFSFDVSALNQDDLTFNSLVAPVAPPATAPPPDFKPAQKTASSTDAPKNYDVLPNPVADINTPIDAPDKVSGEKSDATPVRPNVPFKIDIGERRATGEPDDLNRDSDSTPNSAPPLQVKPKTDVPEETEIAPEVKPKTAAPKKDVTVSKGVINGIASALPKPVYPPAAKQMRQGGAVNVQVLIDESGRVVSAAAASGPPLLRAAAVQAARQARFTPTTLSGAPVKVSGIIVYNFVP